MGPDHSDSKSALELAMRCDAAYRDWQALNADPDCWSDPEKRRSMLATRIAYQDGLAEYVSAVRGELGRVGEWPPSTENLLAKLRISKTP